jgi:predicted metal-dependent HD superfamily phosphohydrolase
MSESNVAILRSFWGRCLDAHSNTTDVVFSAIVSAYSEPHRVYHTIDHLNHMLSNLIASGVFDQAALLATFFHDYIYEIGGLNNEVESADVCFDMLTKIGVSEDVVNRSCYLIKLTADHKVTFGDLLASSFIDADMSILGAKPDEYLLYKNSIAKEYCQYGNYKEKRLEFLKSLLERECIFYTKYYSDVFEVNAKNNAALEMAALELDLKSIN